MNHDDIISIMLNAAPVCGTVWNREGRSVDCNDAALRFFGLTSKQAWLDHHAALSVPYLPGGEASWPQLLAQLSEAFREGRAEFSWSLRRFDGRLTPARITLTRVGQGDQAQVVAYAVEQPDTHSAEASTLDADVRAHLMLDNAPLACTFWNASGELIDCNLETLKRYDVSSKEALIACYATFSPEFQPNGGNSVVLTAQYVNEALQTGRVTTRWMHQSVAGEPMPCEATLVRVIHHDEPMVASFIRDLREETRLAAEKREADERMQIMLDATPLGCSFWDETSRLVDCNAELVRLFGLSNKQEVLARFSEFSPEYQPNGERSVDLMLRNNQQAHHDGFMRLEWMHKKPDGEQLPVEVTLVRVRRAKGHILAAYLRDLREEKRLQAEKRAADERMQIMLDTTPLGCTFWDEEFKAVDCNQAAATLLGLTSKQAFLDRFLDFSPERQPDGRLTADLIPLWLQQAHRDGYARFQWMHKSLQGELVPTEITLIPVKRGQGQVIAAYTRDLREEKRLAAEKRAADERMQIMLDATPLGCSFWDETSRIVDCNAEVVRLFGLSSKQEVLARFPELSPEYQPDGERSVDLIPRYIQQAHRDGFVRLEWMHQKPDGEQLPVEVTLVRVQRAQGHVIAVYIRDLREELKLQIEKNEANEYGQLMLDAMPLCCNLWDEAHNNIACNQEAMKLFELSSRQEYLDRFFELSPEYQPSGRLSSELAHEHIATAFRDGYTHFEWMHQKLNGEPVPAEITLVRIQRGKGCIVAGYTRDLRELRNSAASLKRLETLAFTDKLTGIANRHYFLEQATATLGNMSPGGSACLLFLDIDHFKRVNDTYGHSGGDAILQGLAARFQDILRPYDLFARYGGEEFVILLGRAQLDAALALAERMREAIACTPFEYQDNAIRVSISIGIADCSYPALTLREMIDRADAALYQAKRNGRNRVEFHPPT